MQHLKTQSICVKCFRCELAKDFSNGVRMTWFDILRCSNSTDQKLHAVILHVAISIITVTRFFLQDKDCDGPRTDNSEIQSNTFLSDFFLFTETQSSA